MADQQTIIITGASSGIGRVTAQHFLKQGWRVGLIGRREDQLNETAGGDANALSLPCDVTQADAVDAAFDMFIGKWGRVDALFNNAGTNIPAATPDEIAPDDFKLVIDVNLNGMFNCARAAFRVMRSQDPQGGRIINNGSISAHVPRPGSIAYTASKHAVTGMTRCLSLDGRPFDIACGQVDIGNALTSMAERMTRGVPQADGSNKVEPVMDAQQVADAVWYMANQPDGTNIQFLTVMATKMPFIGRG
ncbi:SDR family oxidoreductase [Paracoccus tegillarcae]|uniref:3-oxoacyl-ACP reductase n=1 Tax=Paracoccus tegillarcae TaxID=1529068 RepID=A0A2K9EEY4_9RHOB|nr:SDR family oxidoreductase [Paracoccus tegillarcae]AUH33513.1 3-oxoacyl-ACP reductase [Paracoccus tegillarcae]